MCSCRFSARCFGCLFVEPSALCCRREKSTKPWISGKSCHGHAHGGRSIGFQNIYFVYTYMLALALKSLPLPKGLSKLVVVVNFSCFCCCFHAKLQTLGQRRRKRKKKSLNFRGSDLCEEISDRNRNLNRNNFDLESVEKTKAVKLKTLSGRIFSSIERRLSHDCSKVPRPDS